MLSVNPRVTLGRITFGTYGGQFFLDNPLDCPLFILDSWSNSGINSGKSAVVVWKKFALGNSRESSDFPKGHSPKRKSDDLREWASKESLMTQGNALWGRNGSSGSNIFL